MTVLRRLPTDGTFNQTRPLDRLVGKQEFFCYDLKSATDRFPYIVLEEVVGLSDCLGEKESDFISII